MQIENKHHRDVECHWCIITWHAPRFEHTFRRNEKSTLTKDQEYP